MKKILISIIAILLINNVFSQQNEFNYFVLRVGMNHHAFSKQPTSDFAQMYAQTPDGQMKLQPAGQFFDYVPGFHAGLFFHYDFESNKAGIIIGAEYNYYGFSSKFQTFNEYTTIPKVNYSLNQTFRSNTISIPALFKFGPEIFDDQNYIYLGIQYNLNLSVTEKIYPDWTTKVSEKACETDEFLSSNIGFVLGYNYQIFNFEINFYPSTFINPEYVYLYDINNTPNKPEDDIKYKPYAGYPKNMFVIKTSITLPLSDWTTKRNYGLAKFFKKIKFW